MGPVESVMCVSDPEQVCVVLTLVGLFVLACRGVVELAAEASGVEPVDVLEHRELGLGAGGPGALQFDELGLEQPNGRLGQRVP